MSKSPLLNDVKAVFLDMDGTIYHGGTLYPTTMPFLDFLKSRNIPYAFCSNNSSYSKDEYVPIPTTMVKAEQKMAVLCESSV